MKELLDLECAWCGTLLKHNEILMGSTKIFGLFGKWPWKIKFLNSSIDVTYKTLLLTQKTIPLFILPYDAFPEEIRGAGFNFAAFACSTECQKKIKFALINERVRLN